MQIFFFEFSRKSFWQTLCRLHFIVIAVFVHAFERKSAQECNIYCLYNLQYCIFICFHVPMRVYTYVCVSELCIYCINISHTIVIQNLDELFFLLRNCICYAYRDLARRDFTFLQFIQFFFLHAVDFLKCDILNFILNLNVSYSLIAQNTDGIRACFEFYVYSIPPLLKVTIPSSVKSVLYTYSSDARKRKRWMMQKDLRNQIVNQLQ